ncbi:lysine-specific demethylase lid-like [Ostrinia furnacalis]|uniref:lysine-specific demethylase lid-like n=1 Tax=Ostrinia furnacalis TaxID=93504 RepID=UPI001039BCDB|nr:lysine-specific demethylase lid-like [Ostrinia furnacalis]
MDSKNIQKNAMQKSAEFTFRIPPEAPVFEPTPEEFLDPLGYIAKIRPAAEKTGICKIKPPARWQPPFSLDVDKLKFVPRIQKVNELEAITRLKLLFLEKILKFWDLQGSSLKIPMIENKTLDLYCLKFWVDEEGGFENCNTPKKWRKIANAMGYSQNANTMNFLRSNYEKILLPYEIFEKSKADILKTVKKTEPKNEIKDEHDNSKPLFREISVESITKQKHENDFKEEKPNTSFIKKTKTGSDIKIDPDFNNTEEIKRNRELRRLACYGPGPKMPGLNDEEFDITKCRKRPRYDLDPLAIYMCAICQKDNRDDQLLICNSCNETYHTFCLKPPLNMIPDGDWRCPCCIAEEVHKPAEAFGFAQAEREYTLQQFGEMADKFKSDYFGMSGHLVPTSVAEKEFWRIISSVEEDVTVEYGADLHSMDHGSGFPTKSSLNLYPGDQEYVDSGWNLNNLPVLDGSVLRFINADISGMTVPWMYVGMCFSAFCWHNEDHWSYSINYLHWGEAKTWYGVPGTGAELLETAMKAAAPDLFKSQPDLLHQLVTIMNPNILMDAGVPLYRTDQNAGEFVVTFPRAYHAGFNQGYNFAEAVNFAPPDWLRIGRECIIHYKNLKRFCVFSHDELICKMALEGDRLDLETALETQKELARATDEESALRQKIWNKGLVTKKRTAFELLGDDERLCEVCKTTCFLSSVSCPDCKHMSCLQHAEEFCQCPMQQKVLNYRYDMEELFIMLQTIDFRVNSFHKWMADAKNILLPTAPDIGRLQKLKVLIDEADELKIPKSSILDQLKEEYTKATENAEPIVIELDDD